MKKLYFFSKPGLLLLMLLLLFTANSCKKEALSYASTASPSLLLVATIGAKADEATNVTQKEIANWITNIPGGVPFPLQWDKMQKGVFNGSYAVKVPIADDAALFFTKQNDSLKVFAYRWHSSGANSDKFTGILLAFNLQTLIAYKMAYKDGLVTRIITYTSTQTPNAGTKTNGLQPKLVKPQFLWGAISNFLQHVGCVLIGGSWGYNDITEQDGCVGSFLSQVADSFGGSYTNPYGPPTDPEDPSGVVFTPDPNIGTPGYDVNISGGGSLWLFNPQANINKDGCDLQSEAIKKRGINDFYGGTPPPPPTAGTIPGCGAWVPFPASYDDLGLGEEQDLPELDVSELDNYPNLKQIIIDLPKFLKQHSNVVHALAYYTGFSESKVLALMQPGKGPKVQVVANLVNTYGQPCYGYYVSSSHTLQISETYVNALNNATNDKSMQAASLLLAITTLHEFIHYGRDANHLTDLYTDPSNGQSSEAGTIF